MDDRREFPNYAFVGGVKGAKENPTIVQNGYSIMTSNNTKEEYPILFCSDDIVNISHCYVDIDSSPAVVVKAPVIGISDKELKSEKFVNKLNQWVDSMNAAQSEIVYYKWEIDSNDGYPKFKKGDVTDANDKIQSTQNELTIYAVGKDLYIQSSEKGHATIFDISGKSIGSIIYDEGLTTVSGLSSGVYLIGGTKIIIK